MGSELVLIVVEIQITSNPFIEVFCNLAFGPEKIDEDGGLWIDDFASISHVNPSKALSTVLFCALVYLRDHQRSHIVIAGSDMKRAYFCYRIIQGKLDYLAVYFRLYGLKYFVRVVNGKDKNEPLQVDTRELTYIPYTIQKSPVRDYSFIYNFFLIDLI